MKIMKIAFVNCQFSVRPLFSLSLTFVMNECIFSGLQLMAFFVILVLHQVSNVSGNAAIITSVNYAFETFSPYALIRFFEFSDREWNITGKCFKDMYVYVQGLRNGEYWAVKLYDATSYYAGAAFAGSTIRLHNPNLCRFLSQQYIDLKMVYPNSRDMFVLPFDVHLISGHFLMEIGYDNYFRFEKIQQMICFPKSCTNTDLEEILEVYLFQTTTFVRNVTYIKHRIVTDNYRIYEDFDFYVIIIILCGALLIHLTVHLLQKYMMVYNSRSKCEEHHMEKISTKTNNPSAVNTLINISEWKNSLESVDLKQFTLTRKSEMEQEDITASMPVIISRQNSFYFEDLLDSMSLPNVIYDWLQATSTPLCGMMFIFSFMFITLHLYNEYSFMSNNLDLGMINNKVKQRDILLRRSVYMMDIYFLINGANLSYDFFKSLPKDTLNACGQLRHVVKLILYKIIGLTPSYTFALYASLLLDKYLQHNITLEIPSRDYRNCSQNILINIFYMDTFFPLTERCMPWTWFIALKIQFYIASCLLMLLVQLNAQYSVIMGVSIISISSAAATLWTWGATYHYGYSTSLLYELTHFNLVSDNICLFVIPYLMGLYLGHIIYTANHNLNINIFVFVTVWLLVAFLIGVCLFGSYFFAFALTKWMRAFIIVAAHLLWDFIIFWIILTALSNYGEFIYKILSFKYANTFEKLTPINVLIAPVVIRLILFTGDVPVYWSVGQLITALLGSLLATFICSSLLFVLLDGPLMAALESLFDLEF